MFLPTINATLNALAAALLVIGWRRIRRGEVGGHRRCMIAAFVVSSLFLVLYVLDKALKHGAVTRYRGPALVKAFYYPMLATHVTLAMAVPVLALVLITLGLRGRDATHRRLARVALPVWLYVSVTGVLIYLMLYHFQG